MNKEIISGTFYGIKKTYRSKNGRYLFTFEFINKGSYIDISCSNPPSLNGRSSAVEKTHIWPSNKICFVNGKEPKNMSRAQDLASQWAEYYLNYIKTGETAS